MKSIQIFRKNVNESILINDDNNEDFNEYVMEFSKAMNCANINIIKLTDCSLILKPSELSVILISDTNNYDNKIFFPILYYFLSIYLLQ
jgi:hypothetical protein